MNVTRKTGRAMTIPAGVTTGVSVSMLITILGAMLVASLIAGEKLKESGIGYGSMIILLAASFAGSMTAWGKVKRQRAAVCLLTGTVYFLMLLCMTALFFGGQYKAVGVTLGLILAGSGTAVLLGLRQGKGSGGLHRKKIH